MTIRIKKFYVIIFLEKIGKVTIIIDKQRIYLYGYYISNFFDYNKIKNLAILYDNLNK